MSDYRHDYRAVHGPSTYNRPDDYVTIPRNIYEKLIKSTPAAPVSQSRNNYYDGPYDGYGPQSYSAGYTIDDGYSRDGYSVEHFLIPQQTPRPENAGPVSSTIHQREASDFFRHELQNIDANLFKNNRSPTGKMVIIDSTVLFGRFYMKGDQVLGNKTEELIRDMSLLYLQRAGFIIVEISSGWRDDHLDKSIKYLVGYKTKKGKSPMRMTKSEIDIYMTGHPVWEEQKKTKLFQY